MVKPHERVRITIHDLLTEAQVDQVIVRAQGLHLMYRKARCPVRARHNQWRWRAGSAN
jgi:hypothetical protein